MVINCHQSNAFVVDYVLRMFEPVVSAEKVVDGDPLRETELVAEDHVEDVCRSVVILWQPSFAKLLRDSV